MPRLTRIRFPLAASARRPSSSPYFTGLFTRDQVLGIIPHQGHDFKVLYDRRRSAHARTLAALISTHSINNDIEDAIEEYISDTASYLLTHGQILFEIIQPDSSQPFSYDNAELELIPINSFIRLFNFYILFTPKEDRKGLKSWLAIIHKNKAWHIKLPSALGSPGSHRRLLRKLDKLDVIMPKFAFSDMDTGKKNYYDDTIQRRVTTLAAENLTAKWGSIYSLSRIEGTTEYYFIHNSLKRLHVNALIREHLVDELNILIPRLGLNLPIRTSGLPTSIEINDAIKKMHRGEFSFEEALRVAQGR